jgi:uncharacterized protein (TIGR00730 family)
LPLPTASFTLPPVKRICVFCGSSVGKDAVFREAAVELGAVLVSRGLGLVYGAGNIGLMGILADAVLERGGSVIGVIPRALVDKEVAHMHLTDLRVVHSMHERKALMAELADGFMALPGGYGTLEEFCEILTWLQLGLHQKPCGLLNVAGFYDPFLAQLDQAVKAGFVRPTHRGLFLTRDHAPALLDAMDDWRPPVSEKWIDRDET